MFYNDMMQLQWFSKSRFKNFFSLVLAVLLISLILLFFINISFRSYIKKTTLYRLPLGTLNSLPKVFIQANRSVLFIRNSRCCYYTCFNAYRCGHNGEQKIRIYVYPFRQFVDSTGTPYDFRITKEFYSILQTIVHSEYYTSNPEEACIFVPSIDTINQNNFPREISQALSSLPYWNGGQNHFIFNMMAGEHNAVINLHLGNAIIAGSGFDSWTYRPSFDISLPVFSPLSNVSYYKSYHNVRSWFIISAQLNIHKEYKDKLKSLSKLHNDLIVMDPCSNTDNINSRCNNNISYKYPDVLQKAIFCIILRGTRLAQPIFHEALASGCIPIIIADTLVMPFQETIDWRRAVIFIPEDYIHSVVDVTKSISQDRILEMSAQCVWLYETYFSTIESVTNVALNIMNQRVFPQHSLFYDQWNIRHSAIGMHSPLFLRNKISRSQGFTAVILAYERIDSLFLLVEKLSVVPSLSKILIVWNNQQIPPPALTRWPKIDKPFKIIRTDANKLSNRFLPFKEIETDAILSLDDDITMLTTDELDFGFEVWREFPDRIVGFPSRTHVWDNVTNSWKYQSEWTNEISMVLTGAAFYHKFWNYLYTTSMPKCIKNWVDEHMNCEDIAMNFLVANVTRKAPVKVAPRKKFKCPECTNTEMLSADLGHMVERSDCINTFVKVYGKMPLKHVEFRADPVLYKDSFPTKLKKYKDVGTL